MTSFISKLFLVAIIFLQFACSTNKDQAYDKAKAISIINNNKLIKSDIAPKVNLDDKILSLSWNHSEDHHQNGRVGNFVKNFTLKKKKYFFQNYKKINLSYSFFNKDIKLNLPVIFNNKLYALDNNGKLSLIDIKNNKKLWSKKLFKTNFFVNNYDPKIYANNSILYAHMGHNKIKAVNLVSGDVMWTKKISSLIISKPIVKDNILYLLSDDNKFYALNATNGDINWVHKTISNPNVIYGSPDPVFYKDYVIISYSSGEVFALNRNNGQEIWSDNLNSNNIINSNYYLNDIDATPIIIKDKLYIVSNSGMMKVIKINSGEVIWQKEIASITNFHINKNYIYILDNDAKLIALALNDASIKWVKQLRAFENNKKPNDKIIYNGLIMADNKLIINSQNGMMFFISPFNGDILGKINLNIDNFHSPIIIKNKIYLMGKNWYSQYILSFE